MTAGVVALQIVLPLALLVWLAGVPAAGWAAYALHVGATAVVLLALWLVAMWAMPPWWLPWAYALCLVAIVAWQVAAGRVESSALWSTGPPPHARPIRGRVPSLARSEARGRLLQDCRIEDEPARGKSITATDTRSGEYRDGDARALEPQKHSLGSSSSSAPIASAFSPTGAGRSR